MDNEYTITTNLHREKSQIFIDRFMLIGYKTEKITKLINQVSPSFSKAKEQDAECGYIAFELFKFPKILSDICPHHEEELIPRETIFRYLFPNKPKLYMIKASYADILTTDAIEEKMDYSQIFTLYSEKEDATYYGFAYILYEKIIEIEGKSVFSPKMFFYLSQYPYFNTFNDITKQLVFIFRKGQSDIPLEFILYNLIKFTPSPLGRSYNLTIESTFKEQYLSINHSSGYPYLQFNLFSLFYVFPAATLLEIFIFIFIEEKCVFYAENMRILNLLMYALASLCYPCNNSSYYKNLYSISYDEFFTSDKYRKDNKFIIGVNSSTVNSEQISKKIGGHFEIDLERKVIDYYYDPSFDEMDEIETIDTLKNFISNTINPKKPIDNQDFFESGLKELYAEIEATSKKINYSKKNQPIFLSSNFFDDNESYMTQNKSIQECFYHFIMRIFKEFYLNSSINCLGPMNKLLEKDLIKTATHPYYISYPKNQYDEEKNIFINKMKLLKFKKYIIDEYANLNSFKTEKAILYELVNWKSLYTKDQTISENCFETIDTVFGLNDKGLGIEEYDFTTFEKYYKKHLSQYFYKALFDSSLRSIDKTMKKNIYKYNKKLIEFDDSVFLKYAYWLNTCTNDQLKEMFNKMPSEIQSNKIPLTSLTKISDMFERTIILQKEISKDSLILFSFLYFFTLTRTVCENESFSQFIIINDELFSKKATVYYVNKYMSLLLNIYARVIRLKKEKNIDNCNEITIYCSIINSILLSQHIPDEELLRLLNLFNYFNENFLVESKNNKTEKLPDVTHWELVLANNKIGKNVLNEDYFISQADYIIYDGDITVENEIPPKLILTINKSQSFSTNIYSPLKLYNNSKKMLKNFYPTLDLGKCSKLIMRDISINLLFYVKNLKTFKFKRSNVIELLLRLVLNIHHCLHLN